MYHGSDHGEVPEGANGVNAWAYKSFMTKMRNGPEMVSGRSTREAEWRKKLECSQVIREFG
jgi:hypothetical protein